MSEKSVSVVTLTWNRRDDVAECLASVRAQTPAPAEIIVVDNAGTDGTAEMVERGFPEATVVHLTRNIGIAGYNEGMKRARGEIVALIDNDMTFTSRDALAGVVAAFEGNERLGCAAMGVDDARTGAVSDNNPKYDEAEGSDAEGYPTSVFDGGGVAFRRSALEESGYYPEDFFIYQNEIALATAIWNAGWEVRYFPRLRVAHKFSGAARPPRLYLFLWHRNYLWYFWRYLPWGLAVKETVAFLLVQTKRNLARRTMTVFACALASAIAGLPRILATRRPARSEVARRMQRIRVEDFRRKHDVTDPAALAGSALGRIFWRWYYRDAGGFR